MEAERLVLVDRENLVAQSPAEEVRQLDLRDAEAVTAALAGADAVVCLRIGSFEDAPTERRHLATWLSPRDCLGFVRAALTAPDIDFAAVYAVSANTRRFWDVEAGSALGYTPVDAVTSLRRPALPPSSRARPDLVALGLYRLQISRFLVGAQLVPAPDLSGTREIPDAAALRDHAPEEGDQILRRFAQEFGQFVLGDGEGEPGASLPRIPSLCQGPSDASGDEDGTDRDRSLP
jgi:hypothetical protein